MSVPRQPDSPIRDSLRTSRSRHIVQTSADVVSQAATAAQNGEDDSALGLLAKIAADLAPARLPELVERLLVELASRESISATVRAQAWLTYARSRRSKGSHHEAKRALQRAWDLAPDPDLLVELATSIYHLDGADAGEELVRGGLDRWPDEVQLRALAVSLAARSGDTDRVRALLEDALAHHPEHPEMLLLLGRLELADGRPERAVEAARRLVLANPTTGRALLVVALHSAWRLTGDPGLLDAVLANRPDDAWLLTGVARALIDMDRPVDARELLDRAHELGDGDVEVYRTRGLVNALLNDYAAASADLERAARAGSDAWLTALRAEVARVSGDLHAALALFDDIDPVDEPGWVAASRAAALAGLGDIDAARSAYETALRQDPDDVNALCGLGEIELDHGGSQGLESAESRLRHAVEFAPSSARAHATLGEVLRRRGELAGAVEAFDRALTVSPAYSYALASKAQALIELGRRAEGIALLAEAAQEVPETPWILDTLVNELADGEDYADADRVLRGVQRTLRDRGASHHLVLVHRAELAKRYGKLAAAERFYRHARDMAPEDGELGRKHAVVLLDLGRAQEALAVLDSLPDAAEPDPEREWTRIDVLWALERLSEVRGELEQLAEGDQAPSRALAALGEVHRIEGDRAEARRLLTRVLDAEDQDRSYVLASLGAVAFDDRHFDGARRFLREALDRSPASPFPLSLLMTLELADGRADNVAALLAELADLNPRTREMVAVRAAGLYGLGDYTTTVNVIEAYLAESGDDPALLRLRGWSHIGLGEISRAVSAFRTAAELPGGPAGVADNVAALCRVGLWTEASRLAGREADAGNAFADVAHAGLWLSAGNYDVAREYALSGLRRVPQSHLGTLYAAQALRLSGDPAGAVDLARRAHHRWPNDSWITSELGECLTETGDEDASAVLQRLLIRLRKQVHRDADELRLLGRCLLSLGRPQEGIHVLLRALSTTDFAAEALFDLVLASLLDDDLRQVVILEHRALEEVSRLPTPLGCGVTAAIRHDLSVVGTRLKPAAAREAERIVERLRALEADLAAEATRSTGTVA